MGFIAVISTGSLIGDSATGFGPHSCSFRQALHTLAAVFDQIGQQTIGHCEVHGVIHKSAFLTAAE
jgi:hypothetical protein